MKKGLLLLNVFISTFTFGQGIKNNWELGIAGALDSWSTSLRATIDFNSGIPIISPTSFKMKYQETQGNISDQSGNLLMTSNGIWIANALGDTMLNGSGLNPNPFTSTWGNSSLKSLPVISGNFFLPWPGDSNKYVLFHISGTDNSEPRPTKLYYTIVDISLGSGLGAVTLKNQIAFQDTLSWGISACKHANGRDWWIIALKDSSDILYKILLTPNGISSISTQSFGTIISDYYNGCQPVFSPDGRKFAFTTSKPFGGNYQTLVNVFDFDRCTGLFSNYQQLWLNNHYLGIGSAFSASSKYLYACTVMNIYQINTDSAVYSVDTVATYDGYAMPISSATTDFYETYLAADQKIYTTSNTTVLDFSCINNPDSGGIACNVQQHSIHIPCWHLASVPNHPNYLLGPITGSICDSLTIGIHENAYDLKLKIAPNPSIGYFSISYLLPRNKTGVFEIYDLEGRKVFSQQLSQWSSIQNISLHNITKGFYQCVIESGNYRCCKKPIIVE